MDFQQIVEQFGAVDHTVFFRRIDSQWECRATYVGKASYSDVPTNGRGDSPLAAAWNALNTARLNKPELWTVQQYCSRQDQLHDSAPPLRLRGFHTPARVASLQ